MKRKCRMPHQLLSVVAALAVLSAPVTVPAAPITYDLTFETNGQSIWDTGSSYTLNETKFLGGTWTDKRVEIDAIVGDAGTTVPNPDRVAYDVAFAACRLLNSASVCINGQTAQVFVPALGSRPSVRSCGTFEFACQAARLVDLSRRAAYDTAFAVCDAAFPASVCRNGQPLKLPVLTLCAAPPSFLTIDTRTGVALSATSDGRAGVELGVKIDSGSVNAKVSYLASLEIPNTTLLDKSTPINFNPNSILAGTNTLNTSFASLAVSVDAVLEVSGGVVAEGCFLLAGCKAGGSTFNIDERAPILSFNADGEGGILLLGQPPSLFGYPDKADGFPFAINVADVATVTLHLPRPDASGGLDPATQKLKAMGEDDLVDLILDVDNIIATAASAPGFFGRSVDIPALGSIGYDIINVAMGPTIDLKQEFELDPTLFVSLAFDKAVKIGDMIVTEWVSAWDMLPAITFLDDVTTVTPTFFVQADLQNRTLLGFDLEFFVDLLQINYDFGLLGKGMLGIGNIFTASADLFETPALYSKLFPLVGFDLQIGDSFEVNFLTGSTGPDSRFAASALNEIVLPGDASLIPEPGTLALLLIGLMAGAWRSQRLRTSPSRRRTIACRS